MREAISVSKIDENALLTGGFPAGTASPRLLYVDPYRSDLRHQSVSRPFKVVGKFDAWAAWFPTADIANTDTSFPLGWDVRPTGTESAGTPEPTPDDQQDVTTHEHEVHQRLLTAPIADLSSEALAALSINKSQMATILGVERPHLYQWLKGQVERPSKAGRLRELLMALDRAGISSQAPIPAHLVTQALVPGSRPLLEELAGDLNTNAVAAGLAQAARINREITQESERRLTKMRAAGHESSSDDEAQATFDQTMAMLEWDNP